MAEIKSTMEMVLARAEKLAAASTTTDNQELAQKGMRIAADFLNHQKIDLVQELQDHPQEDQHDIRKGITETLLRNIVLPRDEDLQATGILALQAIQNLAGDNGDTQAICQELAQILDQYNQHKQQSTQQLDDAIKAQLQQQQTEAGQEVAPENINPAMHPQYQEELSKMLTSLNGKYNDAMDERKSKIQSQFS
jgi:hypothetical protein